MSRVSATRTRVPGVEGWRLGLGHCGLWGTGGSTVLSPFLGLEAGAGVGLGGNRRVALSSIFDLWVR